MDRRKSGGWSIEVTPGATTWRVVFRHGGKQHRYSTGERGKTKAKKVAAAIYAEIISRPVHKAVGGALLDAVADWIVSMGSKRSPEWAKTCEIYARAHWLPRWSDMRQVDGRAVDLYISERKSEGVLGTTIRKELSALRSLLTWGMERQMIAEVPKWTAPKKDSDHQSFALTRGEVKRVLEAFDDADARDYHAVMYWTSFRRATMLRLEWRDIDFRRKTITVRPRSDKARNGRIVALPSPVVTILKPRRSFGLVWPRQKKERLARQIKAAAVAAGVTRAEDVTGHVLRHSRLTHLAASGATIPALQQTSGHKTLDMVNNYMHAGLADSQRLLEEIGEL